MYLRTSFPQGSGDRVNVIIQRLLDVVLAYLPDERVEAVEAVAELFHDTGIFYLNHGTLKACKEYLFQLVSLCLMTGFEDMIVLVWT